MPAGRFRSIFVPGAAMPGPSCPGRLLLPPGACQGGPFAPPPDAKRGESAALRRRQGAQRAWRHRAGSSGALQRVAARRPGTRVRVSGLQRPAATRLRPSRRLWNGCNPRPGCAGRRSTSPYFRPATSGRTSRVVGATRHGMVWAGLDAATSRERGLIARLGPRGVGRGRFGADPSGTRAPERTDRTSPAPRSSCPPALSPCCLWWPRPTGDTAGSRRLPPTRSRIPISGTNKEARDLLHRGRKRPTRGEGGLRWMRDTRGAQKVDGVLGCLDESAAMAPVALPLKRTTSTASAWNCAEYGARLLGNVDDLPGEWRSEVVPVHSSGFASGRQTPLVCRLRRERDGARRWARPATLRWSGAPGPLCGAGWRIYRAFRNKTDR